MGKLVAECEGSNYMSGPARKIPPLQLSYSGDIGSLGDRLI